jgi:Subtilase family
MRTRSVRPGHVWVLVLLCSAAGWVLSSHVAAQGAAGQRHGAGQRPRHVAGDVIVKYVNPRTAGERAQADAVATTKDDDLGTSGGRLRHIHSNQFDTASWSGGGFSQGLLNKINEANSHRMLFVAAAGNDNLNNDSVACFPSSYNAPNVVSVAATDNRDLRASFSNYGATMVDLASKASSGQAHDRPYGRMCARSTASTSSRPIGTHDGSSGDPASSSSRTAVA